MVVFWNKLLHENPVDQALKVKMYSLMVLNRLSDFGEIRTRDTKTRLSKQFNFS